jgi:hypothetical protein
MFKSKEPEENQIYPDLSYSSLLKIKQPLIMQKLNERFRSHQRTGTISDKDSMRDLERKLKEHEAATEDIKRHRNRSERERRRNNSGKVNIVVI